MTLAEAEPSTADRWKAEWIDARRSGESYRSIGQRYGVSHERVRQVVAEEPGTSMNIFAKQRTERIEEIRAWLVEHGPVTRSALLEHFGLKGRQLAYLVRDVEDFPMHLVILSARPTDALFSDDDVYAALRRVWAAVQHERPEVQGLSHALYNAYRNPDEPSPARIIGREQTWELACDHAGIPPGSTYRTKASYGSVWSADDLWDALVRYLDASETDGIRPSYARYDAWQKTQPDCPSGTTMRLKLRALGYATWPGIIEAAVAHRAAAQPVGE
jgi:hypothetical protein